MAKEFKDYDKLYSHLKGTALKNITKLGGHIAREDIDSIDGWPLYWYTEQYTKEEILEAVYGRVNHGIGSVNVWQMFRVSLKGLSTREKLYALGWYWDRYISPFLMEADPYRRGDVIRVNNYLSALKRSGLLDNQLHIVQ